MCVGFRIILYINIQTRITTSIRSKTPKKKQIDGRTIRLIKLYVYLAQKRKMRRFALIKIIKILAEKIAFPLKRYGRTN